MTLLHGGDVLLRDGRLVPADVRIANGMIEAIEPSAGAPNGPALDCSGCTLIPGLIDAHTHLTHYPGMLGDDPARAALCSAARALEALRAGITTVRDMGSYRQLDIVLRGAIADGIALGPRILCAGSYIAMTGGHGHPRGRAADGVDEVRKAAREQILAGADHLKVMGSGGALGGGGPVVRVQYTEPEVRAVVEEAHAAGLRAFVHAHPAGAIKRAIRAGVDSVEHGSFIDDEACALLVAHDVFVTPTFAVYERMAEVAGRAEREAASAILERKAQAFALLRDRGVQWAVGSDCGSYTSADLLRREIVYLVEVLGLSPWEVIRRSTESNAQLLGLEGAGVLAVGAPADVAVVRGNPLADIRAVEDVVATVRGGHVYRWYESGSCAAGASSDQDAWTTRP